MAADPAASAKEIAARSAVQRFVQPGMSLGLGTGSTAAFAVRALAERIAGEGLTFRTIVPTSQDTAKLARSLGIPVQEDLTAEFGLLDLTIDGADEADANLALIKGGRGALLREKLVAASTKTLVIIIDPSKEVSTLGLAHPLPVVVVPYGWQTTRRRVEEVCGRRAVLRVLADGSPFVSDDHLYTLDVAPGAIEDPATLEAHLKQVTGVVDCGLFVGLASCVIVADAQGNLQELRPPG